MSDAGFEWIDQLNAERYQMTKDALDRCLKAGAHPEDLETLAKECGIEWKPSNSHLINVRGSQITNDTKGNR
jgi:hypothetical protein